MAKTEKLHVLHKIALRVQDDNKFRDMGEWVEVKHYSGRYMFGTYCLGIAGPNRDDIRDKLLKACRTDYERRKVRGALSVYRSDSMGLGVVLYWPAIKVKPPSEEGEASS